MTYNSDAPPDPYNPYDPRNDPFHPENPNWPNTGGGGPGGGRGTPIKAILPDFIAATWHNLFLGKRHWRKPEEPKEREEQKQLLQPDPRLL